MPNPNPLQEKEKIFSLEFKMKIEEWMIVFREYVL
jgi:hypothetical protein